MMGAETGEPAQLLPRGGGIQRKENIELNRINRSNRYGRSEKAKTFRAEACKRN
jgi:hypothetical protein